VVAETNTKLARMDEVFVEGTEPHPLGLGVRLASVLRAILPLGAPTATPPPMAAPAPTADPAPRSSPPPAPEDGNLSRQAVSPTPSGGKKKGGPLSKIISIFRRGKSKKQPAPPPQQQDSDAGEPR
jgi:hypothetical protein